MQKTSTAKGGDTKSKITYAVPDLSAFIVQVFAKVNGSTVPIKKQGAATEETKSSKSNY